MKEQKGGLFFLNNKIKIVDVRRTNEKKLDSDEITALEISKKDKFVVNYNDISAKMKMNSDTLTLEDVMLFILIKYTNTADYHMIKNIEPRYYVKTVLQHEDDTMKEYINSINNSPSVINENTRTKIGHFFHKHLFDPIDKPINAISNYVSTFIGDRYEIRENGIFYKYSYEYVDRRNKKGTFINRNEEKKPRSSIMQILNPNIKLKSGYYEETHLSQRAIFKKRIKETRRGYTSGHEITKYDMIYHVFFFFFVEVDYEIYNLYKHSITSSDKHLMKTGLKLKDIALLDLNEYVGESEISPITFTQNEPIVYFGNKRYSFIVDYTNSQDENIINDIYDILYIIDERKFKFHELYETYLYCLQNLFSYYQIVDGNQIAVFYGSVANVEIKMKNALNFLKKLKDTETIEKGYANISDIKFKDTRKAILRLIMTTMFEIMFSPFISIPYASIGFLFEKFIATDVNITSVSIESIDPALISAKVAAITSDIAFTILDPESIDIKKIHQTRKASTFLGLLKTLSLLRILWNGLVRGSFIIVKLIVTRAHYFDLLYENYFIFKKYKKRSQRILENKIKHQDIVNEFDKFRMLSKNIVNVMSSEEEKIAFREVNIHSFNKTEKKIKEKKKNKNITMKINNTSSQDKEEEEEEEDKLNKIEYNDAFEKHKKSTESMTRHERIINENRERKARKIEEIKDIDTNKT